MKIDVTRKVPEHIDTMILMQEEEGIIKGIEYLDDEIANNIETFAKADEFTFAYNKISSFTRIVHKRKQNIILCGVGKNAELSSSKMRTLMANCWRTAMRMKANHIYVILGFEPIVNDVILGHLLAETALLTTHSFTKYLSSAKAHGIECIHLVLSTKNTRHLNRGILEGRIYAEATNFARDLVDEPANILTPDALAEHAKKAALQYGFSIDVHAMDKLKRLKMDALLAVGKGSKNEPKLIVMRYLGNPDQKLKITALVGKGLTFDTGGYCIKQPGGMVNMKNDMGGAAAVLGAFAAIATLKLRINVVGIIAAAENMISGEAYRPGDIITSMAGKTIEVINTDAEGRLTLVDAIHYAIEKEKADRVLDIATLTGSAVAALGTDFSAVLGNNEAWLALLKEASEFSGELLWQMPLHEPYRDLIKSQVADLKNVGGPLAGSITAALFIHEFVQEKPWIHLDIAGTALKDKESGMFAPGATGVGVRLLTGLMRNMEEKE